jgi:hypothetical protein
MDPDFRDLGGRDAYEILRLPPDASAADIRQARRALQFDTHPDRHGDAERSKLVNCAARILLDGEQRRRYDEFRRRGPAVDDGAGPDGPAPGEGAWHGSTEGFHPTVAPRPTTYPTAGPARPWPPPGTPVPPMAVPPMPAPYRPATPSRGSVPTALVVVLVIVAVLVLAVCGVCAFPLVLTANPS